MYHTDVDHVAESTLVKMQSGLYRVGKSSSKRVMKIERERPETGQWRVVWQASMRKDIGKRLMTIVTLAGAYR